MLALKLTTLTTSPSRGPSVNARISTSHPCRTLEILYRRADRLLLTTRQYNLRPTEHPKLQSSLQQRRTAMLNQSEN